MARQPTQVPTSQALAPRLLRALARSLARLLLRLTVQGIEQVPMSGGLLVTMNHLGGADPVLVLGFCPRPLVTTGKMELLAWPVVGLLARAYGMIALRRDRPDRATLKQLLAVLARGGALLVAPEGRESRTGALEAGQGGAAFLAQRANVPIVPVGLAGTAWNAILPAWLQFRRPCVTLTFGAPYRLQDGLPRVAAVDQIMRRIAALLPPEYQGVYLASHD